MALKAPTNNHERKAVLVFNPEEQKKNDLDVAAIRKKKVAAYARVSTEQDAQQNSYEAQIEYYTNFIQSKPEWEFVGVYSDEGISGTSYKKRDGFNQMVADAKAGKIDLILTKSISRFARNTVDSLTITRELKAYGTEVRFEKENISSMDAQAELIFTIMSSIAQEESRSISENVRWGKQRSMESGKVSLPYQSFLGYKRGEDGLPKIVEEEAAIVRRIYQMFLDGYNMHMIARALDDDGVKTPMGKTGWRVETIRSILTNEKYRGDARLQKTYVSDFLTKKVVVNTGQHKQWYIKDSHDAIISPEKFERVQEEMKIRCARHGKYYDSPFTHKIICGECGEFYGHRLWHKQRKTPWEGWACINRYKKGIRCKSRPLQNGEIEKAFGIVLSDLIANSDGIMEEYEEEILPLLDNDAHLEKKIEQASLELASLAEEAEGLVADNARKAKSSPDYSSKLDELENEIKHKKEWINQMQHILADERIRKDKIRSFLNCLKKASNKASCTSFDIPTWHALVESVTVIDKALIFKLHDGSMKAVDLENETQIE